MRLFYLPFLAICLPVAAIFADEAFQTDFHHALVGIPQPQTTFFHRPKSESRASLLYTVSEKGVLAAVNPKDGTLVWRHLLTAGQNETVAGQGKGCLRAGEGESVVVSGLGREVNAWGAFDGRLVWANKFEGEVRDLEVLELPGISEQGAKDVVVLSAEEKKGVLRRLDGNDGAVKWEYEDHGYLAYNYEVRLNANSAQNGHTISSLSFGRWDLSYHSPIIRKVRSKDESHKCGSTFRKAERSLHHTL